jgi:diadenosine tetraphosphate (Ap4A) HIT family hydrolase
MECPPDLYTKVMLKAQILAITIKKVYSSESVYLVTMCDGPMNHFHVQLIPRYANELRGSKNFVKPRKEYEEDLEKRDEIRKILKYK